MTHADPNQFTLVLQRAQAGDTRAADELATLMYGELKAVAVAMLRREGPGGGGAGGAPLTLQPTALVHEAYVRLLGSAGKSPAYKDRKHFFNAAALAMRHILIDRARSGRVGQRSAALDSIVLGADGSTAGGQHTAASTDEQFLALENALLELAERDARQHEVVMLRYFAGLTIEHTAEVMDLSTATVKSEWTYARAWLLHRMEKDGHVR